MCTCFNGDCIFAYGGDKYIVQNNLKLWYKNAIMQLTAENFQFQVC